MKRRTLALGLLTGLAGCSILPERPPLKLYTLLANLNTQDCRAPKRRLSSVRINSPMIASPYDSTRRYVLIKDNRIYNTDINRFSSNPGNLIGDGLREVIQDCGPWNVVLSPNSISTPAYQLTVFVSKFFINAVKKPFAVLSSKWKFLWWQAFPANWFSMKPTAKHRTRQQTICREP